jgi:adenylate cyclase
MKDATVRNHLNDTVLGNTRSIFRTALKFAPFLYLSFWCLDIIYAPEYKWMFLGLRIVHFTFCSGLFIYLNKPRGIRSYQILGSIWAMVASSIIIVMICLKDDTTNVYAAGLNLVALLGIFFVPNRVKGHIFVTLGIYTLYLFAVLLRLQNTSFATIAINSAFYLGTCFACIIIKNESDNNCKSEVMSRIRLAEEIADREKIISEKVEETTKLTQLSNQFSPQVVNAIRNGEIDLSVGIKRSEICSIFIDIVGSTQRVVRLDNKKVHKAISMFMEDTIRTLLKYDITIVQFLGDGILGFSNEPAKYLDFVDRVVTAALEVQARINSRQDEYENYWMSRLEIRVGIAVGFANVGFFGNDKYYRSYTAMGPVMNLASRLCSAANPGQILIDNDVFAKLSESDFETNFEGKRELKGFEQDTIKVYAVTKKLANNRGNDISDIDCPTCKDGTLYLATSADGHFVFKCRSCGTIMAENQIAKKSAA